MPHQDEPSSSSGRSPLLGRILANQVLILAQLKVLQAQQTKLAATVSGRTYNDVKNDVQDHLWNEIMQNYQLLLSGSGLSREEIEELIENVRTSLDR